jgi:hypothetical protein
MKRLSRFVPLKMKRRGVETRIIIAAGNEPPRKVDSALLKAVARAWVWLDEMASGRLSSLAPGVRNTRNRGSDLPGATTRRAQRRDAAQPHRSAARMVGATQCSRYQVRCGFQLRRTDAVSRTLRPDRLKLSCRSPGIAMVKRTPPRAHSGAEANRFYFTRRECSPNRANPA